MTTAVQALLTGRVAAARSFQYRDFRVLWSAIVVHSVGTGIDQVALSWLILEVTGSSFLVGVSMAARMAPFFFFGIPSGAIADRVNRRMFAKVTTGSSIVVAAATAALLLTGVAQPWHLILLAAASGTSWAFQQTTVLSYTYDIVGQNNALNGIALIALSLNLGGFLGSVLGGFLVQRVGVGEAYLGFVAAGVVSLMMLMFVRDVGQAAPRQHDSVLQNFTGAITAIRNNQVLLLLLLLTCASEIFGFSHQTLLPLYASAVLGTGAVSLGWLTAVRRLGSTVALVFLASLGESTRKGPLLFWGIVGFGASLMAMFLIKNLYLALVAGLVTSSMAFLVDTLHKTLMQENVSNEERGRAMGFWVLGLGTGPIGHLSVGAIGGALGAPAAFLIIGGALSAIGAVTAVTMPTIRRLK